MTRSYNLRSEESKARFYAVRRKPRSTRGKPRSAEHKLKMSEARYKNFDNGMKPTGGYNTTLSGKFRPINPHKYVGDVTNIHYRSSLELKFMYRLDSSTDVTSWASEEVRVPYYSPVHKRMKNYYPDFIVKTKTGTTMIEIKPRNQTTIPIKGRKRDRTYLKECLRYSVNEAKWKAAIKYCRDTGMRFEILTEHDIGTKYARG